MPGLPLNTKVLTRNGWKDFNDYLSGNLQIGEEIRVYNYEKKVYEWSPLLNICFHKNTPTFNINTPLGVLKGGRDQLWLVIENCDLEFYSSRNLQNIDGSSSTNYNPNNLPLPINSELCKQKNRTKVLQLGFLDESIHSGDIENDTYNLSRVIVNPSSTEDTWTPITEYRVYLIQQNNLSVLTAGNNESVCDFINSPILNSIITLSSSNTQLDPEQMTSITFTRTNSINTPISKELTVNLSISTTGINGEDYSLPLIITFPANERTTSINLSNLNLITEPRLDPLQISVTVDRKYRDNTLRFFLG